MYNTLKVELVFCKAFKYNTKQNLFSMSKFLVIIITLSFFIAESQAQTQAEKPIGINLCGITDYSRELVFTDAFKQCRTWIPHDAVSGGAWDSKVSIPLNENGYPIEIPYILDDNPPQAIRTLMLWALDGYYPSGKYRLIVKGSGQIRLWSGVVGTFTCPVDTLVNVDATIGGVALEIDSSFKSDPISDIKFILPDYVNSFTDQTFTSEFINFVDDFQNLRFMDWLRTNFSKVETWQDRTSADNYTQSSKNGVAWEYIVELCNLTKKDPWVCIPHFADDEYISNLASLLNENLDPNLKIYLEYSNELWNGAFVQHHEVAELAADFGFTGSEWERAWQYTAKRSADVFYAFENVFTDTNRLVKIIPSQASNSWLTNKITSYFIDVKYNPNQVSADAIAIAPYFGGDVADDIGDEGLIATITIPEIIERAQNSLSKSYGWMSDNKTVADKYGLSLLAYEGGQHIVAVNGTYKNNDALTQKLTAANRDIAMKDMYCQYLSEWYENTEADLFCIFSSHGLYTKYGSWAVKEYMTDTLNPKYEALKECVFADNYQEPLSIVTPELPNHSDISIYPNPSKNGEFTLSHQSISPKLELFDLMGRSIPFAISCSTENTTQIKVDYDGILLINVIDNNGHSFTKKVIVNK